MKPEHLEELLRARPPDEPPYRGLLDLQGDADRRSGGAPRSVLAASFAATAVVALVIGLLLGQWLGRPPAAASGSPAPSSASVVPSIFGSPSPSLLATPLPPGPDVQFSGLLSPADGWALTADGLYLTSDGGASWRSIAVPGPRTDRGVLGVTFRDPNDGWLATLDSADPSATSFDVWRTSDGGQGWTKAVLPEGANRSDVMGAVQFVPLDASHLFLLVEGGMPTGWTSDLYESHDGGTTWSADRTTGEGVSGALAFADANHGVIAGGAAGNLLIATSDGGRSWKRVTVPVAAGTSEQPTAFFSAPTFWDRTSGAITVNYGDENGPTAFGVLVTHDAGQSWTLASRVPLAPTQSNAVAATFLTPTEWLAIPDSGTLLTTIDAGRTWSTSPMSSLPGGVLPVTFVDPQHGWAQVGLGVCLNFKSDCQERTGLYATSDGGRTWRPIRPGS